jgi:hypothetical protein
MCSGMATFCHPDHRPLNGLEMAASFKFTTRTTEHMHRRRFNGVQPWATWFDNERLDEEFLGAGKECHGCEQEVLSGGSREVEIPLRRPQPSVPKRRVWNSANACTVL